jgi:hypothetical protein
MRTPRIPGRTDAGEPRLDGGVVQGSAGQFPDGGVRVGLRLAWVRLVRLRSRGPRRCQRAGGVRLILPEAPRPQRVRPPAARRPMVRRWRAGSVRRRGNRLRWRRGRGRPRVGAPRTLPGLAWCERTRRNLLFDGEFRDGRGPLWPPPVTCATGGFFQIGLTWPFRLEPGLGCDGGLCLCRTGGLTRIRRRTYISFHPPGSGLVTSRHRREAEEGRDVTGGGRMNDARLVHPVVCPANASLMGFAAADPHCCCAGS